MTNKLALVKKTQKNTVVELCVIPYRACLAQFSQTQFSQAVFTQ